MSEGGSSTKDAHPAGMSSGAAHFMVNEMALVRDVRTEDVWRWLAMGWSDLKENAGVSLAYTGLFIAFGLAISFGFYFMGWPYLILPALSGFLLVGPAAGIGYYEISRKHQAGETVRLSDPIFAYRRNRLGIFGLGIALVFLFQVWIRLSFTLYALNFPGIMPEWEEMILRSFSVEGIYFALMVGTVGLVFAAIVFFAAAFAMPLMMDRKTVLVPSLITSAYAVGRNRDAMILWSALIVIFTGIGLVTGFVGLLITLPLLGHATWHAYQQTMSGEDAA